nr:immunoglobulin light chain junction region [Mus musculus]
CQQWSSNPPMYTF